MDEYVVRLGRAPQPPPHSEIETRPVGELRVRPRKVPTRLIVVAVLALIGFLNRTTLQDWLGWAADKVKEPVTTLEGDAQLEAATDALDVQYRLAGSYPASDEPLRAIDPDVAWGNGVRYQQCLDGEAAVLVVRTAHGTISRLAVNGTERDAEGSQECPATLDRVKAWGLSS